MLQLSVWVAIVWLSIGGCSQKSDPNSAASIGGVLYVGVESPFHGFDVLGTSGFINPTQAPLNNLIQEPLFRMDAAGNVIPVLGLSAALSDNRRTWDIRLRRGVVFHDGTPFNADAVVRHWSRILVPVNRYRGRTIISPIQQVVRIDDHAVRFILAHPWPPFLEVLADELLLFNFIPSPTAVDADSHDRKPVGTGPFKFHAWNASDHFVVMKNDEYWQQGKPQLNKVVFRTVPDHQTRFASLLSGELDMITLDRGPLIAQARDNEALQVFQSEGSGAEIILINTSVPPLNDPRVRRALALANNQALHIKMVYGGTLPLVHHPFGEWVACPNDSYIDHHPESARQLIADHGQPLTIECLHSNTSRGRDTGALLQQLFKSVGIHLVPVALSTGPHIMRVMQKDYQLATWRIPPARDHGPQLYRSFHSQSPANFSGYHAPDLDRLLERQRIETDPVRRRDLLCQAISRLNRDVPMLYRGGRRFYYVTRKKIRDMMGTPGIRLDLASAWLDEPVKFNAAAYVIEQDVAVAEPECAEPGDTERVKAAILGSWNGRDNWGAAITATFNDDQTVTGGRRGNIAKPRPFFICGSKVHWTSKNGARVVVTLATGDRALTGQWTYASYSGEFRLTPTTVGRP